MHPLTNSLLIAAVHVIGLLAGVMLGVAMEQQTAQQLASDCWIVRQNLNDRLFRKVMPPTFVLTLAASSSAAILLHRAARFWMSGACLLSVLVIAITVALEVPLNNKMSQWQPGFSQATGGSHGTRGCATIDYARDAVWLRSPALSSHCLCHISSSRLQHNSALAGLNFAFGQGGKNGKL
jgi:hypothetical protein